MAEPDVPVVRIVVDGCPAPKSITPNVPQTRGMLLRAFERSPWPGKAMFTVTPGGFIVAPFPYPWRGKCGWASSDDDFQALVKCASKVVREVLMPQVLSAARGRTNFLTLGVDLSDRSGKRKMDRKSRGTHAELIAIVDVEKGEPVRWTGKSYPTLWQQDTLVQEVNLESHLRKFGTERVLVLGCHDLNMFSGRTWAAMTVGSRRHARSKAMRDRTSDFEPTMILHHPHSTDSPRIWATAWSGARDFLPESDPPRHVWASGIGFYRDGTDPRGTLHDVQRLTRCCEEHVKDVVVKPSA